jgi:hypothetical protein
VQQVITLLLLGTGLFFCLHGYEPRSILKKREEIRDRKPQVSNYGIRKPIENSTFPGKRNVMMNNASCLSARDVRMISAPRKLNSVMYELTTSVTNLPQTSHVLKFSFGTFASKSIRNGPLRLC